MKDPTFVFTQPILQLEKRRGGYYYLRIDAETVHQFPKQRYTRLLCNIHNGISYSCGLNHLGDGNFFIIVSTKLLKKLGLQLGDQVEFIISQDPNPLGVEVPEVLEVLLEQDPDAKSIYDRLTDGKKRSLIFSIQKLKNIDRQVEIVLDFLQDQGRKMK